MTRPEPDFLDAASRDDFNAFLHATADDAGSTGARQGYGLGVATPDSVAVTLRAMGALLAAGSSRTRDQLERIRDHWFRRGRPGHDQLACVFLPTGAGWFIRPRLRPPVRLLTKPRPGPERQPGWVEPPPPLSAAATASCPGPG